MQRQRVICGVGAVLCGGMVLLGCGRANAQKPSGQPVITTTPQLLDLAELAERARPLIEQARRGNGSAGITLDHYNGHYTMLTARTATGGAELHQHFADFLIVVDGTGTEMTGGTIVDPQTNPGGEIRGKTLEGATRHILHKGDVLHIPAGTPHQAVEGPGESISIFVIKVEEPASAPMTNTSAGR